MCMMDMYDNQKSERLVAPANGMQRSYGQELTNASGNYYLRLNTSDGYSQAYSIYAVWSPDTL